MRYRTLAIALVMMGCGLIAPLEDIDMTERTDALPVPTLGGASSAGAGGSAAGMIQSAGGSVNAAGAGQGGEAGENSAGAAGEAGTAGEAGDAGSAGSAGHAGSAGAGCGSARPPARPTVRDSSGEEFVFALKLSVSSDSEQWRTTGLDLDQKCTVFPEYARECNNAGVALSELADGEHGIDNSVGRHVLPLLLNTYAQGLRGDQERGAGVLILRVFDYNGLENDPLVNVWVLHSAHPQAADDLPKPKWDGTDSWFVESSGFVGGIESYPAIRDDDAYVADGMLVVRLPERADILMDGLDATVRIQLADARILGRIAEGGERLEHATLSGRWALTDIDTMLAGIGLCPSQATTKQMRALIAGFADIRATVDDGGPHAECNALSLGLRFDGYRGTYAGAKPSPVRDPKCNDSQVPAETQ